MKSLHFLHGSRGEKKKKKKKKKGSRLFGALFYYYHYHYYYYKGGKNRSRVGSCLRFCPCESGVVVVLLLLSCSFEKKRNSSLSFVARLGFFSVLLCSSLRVERRKEEVEEKKSRGRRGIRIKCCALLRIRTPGNRDRLLR